MGNLLLGGGIGIVFGFVIAMLALKRKDLTSNVVEFIIYAKQQNKTDEDIHKSIDKLVDIILEGYNNLQQDPKAAYEKLRNDENLTKEMKALIKAEKKLIKKANKMLN